MKLVLTRVVHSSGIVEDGLFGPKEIGLKEVFQYHQVRVRVIELKFCPTREKKLILILTSGQYPVVEYDILKSLQLLLVVLRVGPSLKLLIRL